MIADHQWMLTTLVAGVLALLVVQIIKEIPW